MNASYTHGLRATILTDLYHSPNGGLSATHKEVTIVGPGVPAMHAVRATAPAVVLTNTTATYTAVKPAAPVPADHVGYMASGAYVTDSGCYAEWQKVFGTHLPIPLHDRIEKFRP